MALMNYPHNLPALLAACTALLACGCSSTEVQDMTDATDTSVPLNISVSTAGAAPTSRSIVSTTGKEEGQVNRIGVVLTAEDGHSDYADEEISSAVFSLSQTGSADVWSASRPVNLQSREARLYAWYPVSGNGGGAGDLHTETAGNTRTIPVEVPATQTFDGENGYGCSGTDYLYGSAKTDAGDATPIGVSSNNNSKPAIYLQHALAQVVFTMDNASDRPADTGYDYVKSITLADGNGAPFKEAREGSRMSLADGVLTNTAATAELSLTPSSHPAPSGATGTPRTVAYGLVVPKAATTGTGISVKVVMGRQDGNDNEREYTVPAGGLFDAAWEKGKRYTYHLTLGNHNIALNKEVEIAGWQEGENGSGEMPPEGAALQVLAGIGSRPATRAASDPDNAYDRNAFIKDDRIRITRSNNGNTAASDYQLNEDGSWSVAAGTAFTFESAATYSALYPPEYNGVRPDQQQPEEFRLSNRLETPAGIRPDRTGKLAFTQGNSFTHANGRITLTLTGTHDIAFPAGKTTLTLKGTGIRSGSGNEETIYPLRPEESANTWCAVFFPLQAEGNRTITVTLEVSGEDAGAGTSFNVTYSCNIDCVCRKDTHYRYALSVINDRLVPEGMDIEGWQDAENGYVGDFDKESNNR